MRILDELGEEIERVARAAGPKRPRRRWLRGPAWMVGVIPVGAAAVAVAATTGLLTGDPVKNPPDYRPNPALGVGAPDVQTARLLAVQTPDPSGGPAWGMRLFKTSRGFGCVQIGRLVDGKLGVIGKDGSFNNDGKFHERGPQIIQQSDCRQPDAAGHVFVAISYQGLPDSADGTGCVVHPLQGVPTVCPTESLRVLYYGLLGPQGEAVTYRDATGALQRQAAVGPEGAYVVVLPAPDPLPRNFGYYVPGVTPASGLKTVDYRDGSSCDIRSPRRLGGAKACPLKGFVASTEPKVTQTQVATTVRVKVATHTFRPKLPKGARFRGPAPAQRHVRITFRARVAANARRFYTVAMQLKGGRGCHLATFGAIARDVKPGAVVTQLQTVPASCHKSVLVTVGYAQPPHPGLMPFEFDGRSTTTVGRATAKLP